MNTGTPQSGERPPEDAPTGTFGGPRIALPDHITPCTHEEQAEHLAVLAEEMSTVSVADLMRRHTEPPRRRPRQGSA